MAVRLLQKHDVSDLCIGKPALRWLPPSSTVADAIAEIKRGGCHGPEAVVAVWDGKGDVAGRLCMADMILLLCDDGNLGSPAAALQASLSDVIAGGSPPVRRVEPNASVLEAVDAFLDGAHSLVVPIRERWHAATVDGGELCWLTVEDLVRFFLGSIALFSPTASLCISALGVVRPAALTVSASDPALSAMPLLGAALAAHTSVAVLSGAGCPRHLAGEISPSTLSSCDVSVAAAIAALSAGDLMAFVDFGSAPTHATVGAVRDRLCRRNLLGMLDLLDGGDATSPSSSSSSFSSSFSSASSTSSSSDDEDGKNFPTTCAKSCMRRVNSYSARMGRRAEEAIVCHRGSSLVAVMVQAIAHRVTYVWVVDEEYELVGVVGFMDVLRVLREDLVVQPPS